MLTPIELIRATVDPHGEQAGGRIVNITSGAVKAPIDILGLQSNGALEPEWLHRRAGATARWRRGGDHQQPPAAHGKFDTDPRPARCRDMVETKRQTGGRVRAAQTNAHSSGGKRRRG